MSDLNEEIRLAVLRGRVDERERIIKLLEEEFNDTWPTGVGFVETSLPNLIALIKGEAWKD